MLYDCKRLVCTHSAGGILPRVGGRPAVGWYRVSVEVGWGFEEVYNEVVREVGLQGRLFTQPSSVIQSRVEREGSAENGYHKNMKIKLSNIHYWFTMSVHWFAKHNSTPSILYLFVYTLCPGPTPITPVNRYSVHPLSRYTIQLGSPFISVHNLSRYTLYLSTPCISVHPVSQYNLYLGTTFLSRTPFISVHSLSNPMVHPLSRKTLSPITPFLLVHPMTRYNPYSGVYHPVYIHVKLK